MNSDTLLTHIRLEQRCLIDIDKKLHELECLLSCSDPIRFFEVAKNMALLSERSTAQLRNFLFTVCGGMPQDYYLQAAEMQGICQKNPISPLYAIRAAVTSTAARIFCAISYINH